jgi:hypothetical protein
MWQQKAVLNNPAPLLSPLEELGLSQLYGVTFG